MSIFDSRLTIKPQEYPHLSAFKDAIRHSYWLHTEFKGNIENSDVQDFKIRLSEQRKEVVKKTILAISQVEVNVKTFWLKLFELLPKHEIFSVGVTFAESEERHFDAYFFILEVLGMQSEFEKVNDIPVLRKRVEYLSNILKGNSPEQIAYAVVVFSLFIEHISLFGQFYIMMSFNKRENLLKGLSNVVEATSKEEQIHGMFGIELFRIMKAEKPEIFNDTFNALLSQLVEKAVIAETDIINWTFQGTPENDSFLVSLKQETSAFVISRFIKSCKEIGIEFPMPIYNEDEYNTFLKRTEWFDEEIHLPKDNDFFNKRGTDYSKKQKTVNRHELF